MQEPSFLCRMSVYLGVYMYNTSPRLPSMESLSSSIHVAEVTVDQRKGKNKARHELAC